MEQKRIFSFSAFPYRQKITIDGFYFGDTSRKTVAVVGATRGDEYQQVLISGLLIKRLKQLEAEGLLSSSSGIVVIPSASQFSMNVGKRFFPVDNTDINRMFPGYDKGETTQRLADGVFKAVKDYKYGIQMASFYLHGKFIPHVRTMYTDYQDNSIASDFGLPYFVIRHPQPIDTTTLNYNWQIFGSTAFSLHSGFSTTIDMPAAQQEVEAIIRFLVKRGVLSSRTPITEGEKTITLQDTSLKKVISAAGGFFFPIAQLGQQVRKGDLLGRIINPVTAESSEEIYAGSDGILFFTCSDIAVSEHTAVFGIADTSSI